jgi:hypothetical protein
MEEKTMQHARPDYNRIQDPENKIPKNEPVFLLRGQDVSAPDAVEAWADANQRNGGDPDLTRKARAQAQRMRDWQICCKKKTADWPG